MLPRIARIYIGVVVALGTLSLSLSLYHLRFSDIPALVILALLGAFGGALKIRVPGVDGNVSLSFLPFVIAAVRLSLPEAVLIAAAATVVQARAFSKRRFQPGQVAFNCSALVLSVVGAAFVSSAITVEGGAPLVRLAVAALVYYTLNSALVTTVIGLAGGQQIRSVWTQCLRLYLPYLLAGLFCFALAFPAPYAGLSPGLAVLPLMLLVRHYFKSETASGGRRPATGPS